MDIGLNATSPKLSFKERLLHWLRLTDSTTIKVYHGFGHAKQLTIYGHVLKFGPVPRKHYSRGAITNTLALLRLFMVKPYPNVTVQMNWKGKPCTAKTDTDGFFRFQWEADPDLKHGWHDVVVNMVNGDGTVIASGKGGGICSIQYAICICI